MTRIPQLEQELVTAAGRLQKRRVVRPALGAALAVGVAAVVVALAVLATVEEGGDRRPGAAGAPPPAPLSPEQEIERIGNKWAPLFAAAPHPDTCSEWDQARPYREVAAKYMAQPACERLICQRISGPIVNCTPLSPEFKRSFADARVQDIAFRGRHRAAAKFSNGETVEFSGGLDEGRMDPREPPWLILKVGPNAGRKFFQ